MFELVDGYSQNNAVIKVIGIGGGGGNALEHMLTTSMEGVDFICANTDSQALKNSAAPTVLQLMGIPQPQAMTGSSVILDSWSKSP